MAPPLLHLRDIRLDLGGAPLLEGAELAVGRGDRICLVGRNGCGKSTLLRIAAGLREPDGGERFVQPGTRISYLAQEPDFTGAASSLDFVASGLAADEAEAHHRAEAWLDVLKIEPGRDPATLSGGEKRRVALARALVGDPDILLLDEPTNHMDLPTIRWLEETVDGGGWGLVVVSHDRAFLRDLTRTTLWLDQGAVRRLDAGFAEFDAWSERIIAEEAADRAKLDKRIAEETRWSREGITARRKRNQGRLRRLQEMREERARRADPAGRAKLEVDSGSASGKLVAEAEEIAKAYDGQPVIRPFSTRILRGDRVGIIGRNGAGKTTLLKMLTGELAPDSGSVRLGTNLSMVHVDQERALLQDDRTVWDTLCDMGGDQVDVRGRPRHVVSYLKDFLFAPEQARSPVGSLSGGERNRLLLAKTLARPANLLVLDEPTNDLDMDTLDLLQEVLADFDGTVLLVSHDRDFLDRVVTSTIVLEGDGRAGEYPGGYSDMLRQHGEVPGLLPVRAKSRNRKPESRKQGKPKAKPSSGKLSYKDKRRLEQLPGEMEALQARVADLESRLADPDLYTRDPEAFTRATRDLEQAQEDLAAHEEEWLTLEMRREELEGA